MESGLTNRFAVKETNWSYHNQHFFHWTAIWNHLATDVLFPQRVNTYRANSCYAHVAENNEILRATCCRGFLPPHQDKDWAGFCTVSSSSCPVYLQGVLHWKIQLFPGWSQSCQQVNQMCSNKPLRPMYLKALTPLHSTVADVSRISLCVLHFFLFQWIIGQITFPVQPQWD